ncbi:MAG TPA: iron export ABC transporter permease subunit FetB [Acidimicrobiia bacterium]|nr:iron export ABC transporter permease subunit FetB [Acidimicrobiia bacterium]
MTTTDVGLAGVAASLVLVLVAVVLSAQQGLGVERTILWAAGRALVQLLVVGSALTFVIEDDAPVAYALLWVAAMVVIAAVTVQRRAPDVPGVLPVALLAVGSATAVSQAVLFGLGVFPFEPVTIVPLAGMVVGNSLSSAVTAAQRAVAELSGNRLEIEARLALGQPSKSAARPYVRAAVRTALTPQIESTKTVGLIALPGAMTGLILAGVDPVDAVLVQVVVMYFVLGAAATCTAVVGVGVTRRLFTADHRLVRVARPG